MKWNFFLKLVAICRPWRAAAGKMSSVQLKATGIDEKATEKWHTFEEAFELIGSIMHLKYFWQIMENTIIQISYNLIIN